MPSLRLIIFTLVLAAAGCAANKPVIYPNTHSQSVGTGQVEMVTGAVGGAIGGSATRGAKIGAASGATASLLHAFFKNPGSNPTYCNFVERCLSDRGYDLAGWN